MDLKVNDKAWKIFIGSYVMMDRKKSPVYESELQVSLHDYLTEKCKSCKFIVFLLVP